MSLDRDLTRFLEATKRIKQRRAAEQEVRRLEKSLQRAFRIQGKKVVQGMRTRLRMFFAEGFDGHAAFLSTPLKESVSENDWLMVWIEVAQDTTSLFVDPIDAAVEKAMTYGAEATIGGVKMAISFSLDNPRAVKYLNQYGAQRVKGLNLTTQDDLRKLISGAVDQGWSWKQLEDAIGSQFDDYSSDRAHLIATKEIGDAYCEGNLIVAQDLQAAGLEMEKMWDPNGDGCAEICQPNADQGWIPIDEPFQSGDDRPLGHPGCFCDLLTRLKGSED